MAIEEGTRVRQKTPVIEGDVVDIEYDKSAKSLRYLVEYEGEDGETHKRWFTEADVEDVNADA